jgi:hypothetical protein
VIYTSPPASHRWKEWVKQSDAVQYIMDVWSEKELRTMLYVVSSNTLITLTHRTSIIIRLNDNRGVELFKKYGPSPRVIISILMQPERESEYLEAVKNGAVKLASRFSELLLDIEMLDFTSDISSKIFTVRPGPKRLHVPTAFLASTLGVAVSAQMAALQNTFFVMLSSHPSLRGAAGWVFENFAHVRLSDPKGIPMKVYLHGDPDTDTIPTSSMTSGVRALSRVQPPFNFYWRPVEPNFPGIDALIRVHNIVWVLQFTISASHKSATKGLERVRKYMNHKSKVEWRLVMVSPTLHTAESARDSHVLKASWAHMPVYACELPLGQFDDNSATALGSFEGGEHPSGLHSCQCFVLIMLGVGIERVQVCGGSMSCYEPMEIRRCITKLLDEVIKCLKGV